MTSAGTAATAAALTTLGLAAASWVVALRQMNGMDMGVATELGSFAFFVAMWVSMITAMMLPGAVPAVSRFVQVAQYMTNGDDGIALGHGVVRQLQQTNVFRARNGRLRELEHGRRRVGRHHTVTRLDKVTRRRAAAAAELEHQAALVANRLEQGQDAWCASVRIEPIPALVHVGEIAPVERWRDGGNITRARFLPANEQTVRSRSRGGSSGHSQNCWRSGARERQMPT